MLGLCMKLPNTLVYFTPAISERCVRKWRVTAANWTPMRSKGLLNLLQKSAGWASLQKQPLIKGLLDPVLVARQPGNR